MGLFDFVKDAGSAIFSAGDDSDITEAVKPVRHHVRDHGIDVSNLDFKFTGGGKLVIEGSVTTPQAKEQTILIAGNVKGVAQVDDRIVVAQGGSVEGPAPDSAGGGGEERAAVNAGAEATPADWASDTYTVKSGDSLSKIAKAIYGDPMKYTVIFEANTPMLADPDKIYPGQVLRIPPG